VPLLFNFQRTLQTAIACVCIQVQQTLSDTDVPTISVDLGLFRGKKYLDFKNFSVFVNSPKTKNSENFQIFLNLLDWRLWVAVMRGGARGRQPRDSCFFLILKMTASFLREALLIVRPCFRPVKNFFLVEKRRAKMQLFWPQKATNRVEKIDCAFGWI
jgi:hypothetical protein